VHILPGSESQPLPSGGGATAVTATRRPELDGLRGLAVLAVVAFHTNVQWARAGFLGVDLFFGLSGYLITTLLMAEFAETGSIRLGAFYLRRALRLLPALLVLVSATALFSAVAHTPGFSRVLRTGLYALLDVENWANIYAPDTISARLGHLWSLSVEGQFYAAWSVLLLVLLRIRPRWLVPALVCGIGLSAGARVLLYANGASVARVYTGSDVRADVILAGCLLAALERRGTKVPRLLAWSGFVPALLWLVVDGTPQGFDSPRLYREGFCLVTAGVFGGLALALDYRPRWLQWRPLMWLGTVSYSLYLWQVPLGGFLRAPLVLVPAALTMAALSYYLVERPCLRLKSTLGEAHSRLRRS